MAARVSPVRVDAFLADAVSLHDGKLEVAGGGWTHLIVSELPARQRRIGLAMLLRTSDAATHAVAIRLDAPDGKPMAIGSDGDGPVTVLEGTVTAGPPVADSPLRETVVPLAIAVEGLTFATPGAYRFVIAIDGVDAKIVPFAVLAE